MRYATLMLAVFVVGISCSPAIADVITEPIVAEDGQEFELTDLQGSAGFIWGDKLFDEFSFSASSAGGAIAPTEGIKVTATLFGIEDEIGIYFNALWQAGPMQWVDTTIRFRVTVLDPDHSINGVLLGSGAMGAAGTGGVSITESIYSSFPGPEIAHGQVVDIAGFRVNENEMTFAPTNQVYVVKDIGVSGGTLGSATVSQVYQVFHQIPEPASLSLLGMGVIALFRRRR